MSAFENAKKLKAEDVIARLAASGLEEYGLENGTVADRIAEANATAASEDKPLGVVVSLNNADIDHSLLALITDETDKLIEGMKIAAYAMGTENIKICVPESRADAAEAIKAKADACGAVIECDIVDVRKDAGCLKLHPVTALKIVDLFNDALTDTVPVAVNGESLKYVDASTKVSELVDLGGAKAIYMNYQYYTPAEAQELTAKDATNGTIDVLTAKNCIVDTTLKKIEKSKAQSCGKCVFCREGLIQLQYEQREITMARGREELLSLGQEIGDAMLYETLCTMGQNSSKVVLSAIKKFGDEFTSHIKKNVCPAGVCQSFVHIYIDPKTCTGCGDCMDVCPVDCIEGKPKFIHMIDEFDCTKCGKCIEACDEEAVIMTAGKLPKLPTKLTKVGKFKKH